jgi:fucose 4-O-acetylase-like acetyltransferase
MHNLFTPGFAMWYLWALFVFRTVLPYLLKIQHIIPISFVISWIAGFIDGIDSTFSLSRIICFLPYFLMGYSLKQSKFAVNDGKTLIYKLLSGGGNSTFIFSLGGVHL